ncbi:MAG: protoporphyrin IX magnesium chelatase [Bacteroidales bacterium]|nr:MAG: protoporphyrin IX magnesium chelatase [Bacteroidales bacterium]
MGIKLSADAEEQVKQAGNDGTKIYLQSSTNPRLELTNIEGRQLDYISDYLDNAGNRNYRNMLNYIRREIDGKKFFSDTIEAPYEIPSDVLFYKNEDASFEKVKEFEQYCNENDFHKINAQKVILFTSVPGPFNTNREHINSLIDELQARNLNVYPVSGFGGRLNYMKEIQPDLIVYLPHGRLSMGGSSQMMEAWLKEQNIPVLCPLSVFQKHDKWMKDKQGMFGGLLSQSVTMPEFDGGIVPYAVFAQYEDENGYLLFRAVPERLKKFGDIAENYLHLKKIKKEKKKIAIVYFKGPGKNALVAANMEVLPSMHNMLLRLKKEGYDLGDLPADFKDFQEIVNKKGPVLGTYAEGAFDEFLQSGEPELIPANQYETWCRKHLPDELYAEVEKKYGKAPGIYMSVYKDNKDYLAIARVQFGNVVLLPQPLPGIGENVFQLIHGAKAAPPHAYIAPYLWIQEKFKADAVFHFGTHGSLEFTPGKQIALSDYDWTDPLIGTIPHFYIYTISNVGEGMIAKRRSYATTQTYLTPPFIKAKALGGKEIIRQKIHKYEQAAGSLRKEYALSVKQLVVKEQIHKDLGLDSIVSKPYSKEEMIQLANYLEEIENEKVTGGLYTMGIPYTPEKLKETIRLMFVDALAYNLAEVDIVKNKITRENIENKSFFNQKYTYLCEEYINEILKAENPNRIFNRLVSRDDYSRAIAWKQRKESAPKRKMEQTKHKAKSENDSLVSDEERKQLRELIIQLLPDPEKTAFIGKLNSDKEYEKAMSLLNPQKRARAQRMAKFIPAMARALETAADSSVNHVLRLIKKEELRTLALKYLDDEGLEEEVTLEKQRQDQQLVSKAMSSDYFSVTAVKARKFSEEKLSGLDKVKAKLQFYEKKKAQLIELLKPEEEKQIQLLSFIENNLDSLSNLLDKQIGKLETIEANFANAVFQVENTINSIQEKKKNLHKSPEYEMLAILNSLKGGYTVPSSGGDPIANPAAIPTGRNLYAISAEHTPSKEAWEVGKKLAKSLLTDYRSKHENEYPQKISFTLWSSSFIETEGTTIAQILYFLGVEPVWNPFGRVKTIRLIPSEELGRPRIDAVVQTSGQLRDLAASRLFLINKAISLVAEVKGKEPNFVSKGIADAERSLIEKGFSPKKARELSKQRVFGGVNGNYGTGIMEMVENSGRWDSTKVVAQTYINNMGAVYGDSENWGDYGKGVFEAALLNTDAVVQPRQSNTWGALSLDHVYEFMGGINLAVKEVTGKDAEAYFNDFRNTSNPRIQGLKEAIWVESRTTLLNPRYIKEYMKGGASSAETFAETFRNTFGWNVMKPSVIENRLWDELYDVYVQDKLNLDIKKFFQRENPYALQEMTAVMLETVRKGYWKATPEQIKAMAKLHAELVKKHEAGCSGFVCDNQKLKAFISQNLNAELKNEYSREIDNVRKSQKNEAKENIVLKKEEKIQKTKVVPQFSNNQWIIAGSAFTILFLLILVVGRRRKTGRKKK